MKLLLTGGSGDLGSFSGPILEELGHQILNLDTRPPERPLGSYIEGSSLNRELLSRIVPEVDCVVHIAALHGVHEFRKTENPHRFWDVNVTGTFNLLNAAAEARIGRFIFISSTSIDDPESIYGHTKLLAEETCRRFTIIQEDMSVICLRPRAFIPPWNREVYSSFNEWAKWFWGGAVHISDVADAVVKSVKLLSDRAVPGCPVLVLDGKYDYSAEDLAFWDRDGAGSTFKKHYAKYFDLATRAGLDPTLKPSVYDISKTEEVIGYRPQYSLRNLLEELART